MKKLIAAAVVVSMLAPSVALASVDSKGAAYFGGTAGFKDADDPGKHFKGQTLSIPYAAIVDLEYGQKAGRRVGAAAATTILVGPIGLLTLFSKKRNHYLTIGFKDADAKDQVAVIELGKEIVRTTLPIMETRSGKKVTYQDEEAKRSSNK